MELKWEPEVGADRESAVHQAVGAASMCWENMSGTGVFNDTQAKAVADGLLAYLYNIEPAAKVFPYESGDFLVLGPECFISSDRRIICYQGENYYAPSEG